jgi:predicted nucleotidyltransferase
LTNDFYTAAVNRAYYAIFYAANALLAIKKLARSKQGKVAMTSAGLTVSERRALQEFMEYLRKHIENQVEHVALFGSKARGDSGRDSGIDVLIILREENRQLRREILIQAARLSLKHDVFLSPRVIGAERWEKMQGFSLYQNVQQEATSLPMTKSGIF